MQCIKCKKEIPDDSLRCPHCGIKVNMYCPECNTLNRFGSKYCSECGSELLKVCLKCGSNNLYYAENCRKCGAPLSAYIQQNDDNVIIEEEPETTQSSQNDVIIEEPEEQPKKMNLRDFLNAQAQVQEDNSVETTINKPEEKQIISENKPNEKQEEEIVFIKKETAAEPQITDTKPVQAESSAANIPAPVKRVTPRKIQNCITNQGASAGNHRNASVHNTPAHNTPQKPSNGGFFGFGKKKEKKVNIPTQKQAIPNEAEVVNNVIQNEIPNELQVDVPNDVLNDALNYAPDDALQDIIASQQTLPAEEEDLIQVLDVNQMTEEKKNLNLNTQEVISNKNTEEINSAEFSEPMFFEDLTEPTVPEETIPEKPVLQETISEKIIPSETIQVKETPINNKKLDNQNNIKPQENITQTIPTDMENHSFSIAKQTVIKAIVNSPQSNIIAITGDFGYGKSVLLKQIITELSANHSVIPLYSRCSQSTQISCLGAFQDAFLTLLGLPGCCGNNVNAFIKSNKASLKQAFPNLSDNEISDFVNFLYPNKTDVFANISKNKTKLFELMNKTIRILSDNVEHFIIAIDNFDFIDGMSYEFLTKLIDNEEINNKIQIIITYQENKAAEGYFASKNVNSSTAKTIHLKPLTQEEAEDFMMQYINNDKNLLSDEMKKSIYTTYKGSGLCIEHYFALLYETGIIAVENNFLKLQEFKITKPSPGSIDLIIKERLKMLMPQLRTALFTAVLLGYRFDNQIFAECLNVTNENANTILTQLKNILYIEELTAYSSTFRSYSVWKILENEAKTSDEYKDIIKNMIRAYSKVIVSSPMNIIGVFENEIEPSEIITKLNEITSLIAALGDINLYTIAQKQKLKFINQTNSDEYLNLSGEIYEEIGTLNYKHSPLEAIPFLSNAIDRAQKINNPIKAIELCGYLVNSCYLTGNYFGVIETVDLVIKNASKNISELELALIKERKLKALYNIGHCEEIINLMSNEICVPIQDAILGGLKDENLRNLAATAWVESNIILASAYALQGNPLSFDVITDIKNFLPTINIQTPYFKTKTQMIEALAYTSIGEINSSNEILNDAAKDFEMWNSSSELLSEWNLINLINKTLTDTPVTKEELFELATFANNSNEYFVKHIIKLILGYFIQKDGDYHKALEIYKEQITYFSNEKNAIGSLSSWYLIAQAKMVVENATSALNLAQQTLEVAQSPKINNYNFIIYLKKFIAEVYMSKGDLESSKMYLEQAISLAQENGLFYALFKLLLSYAEYLEESLHKATNDAQKSEIALDIIRVHNDAKDIAEKLNLANLKEEISNAQAVFNTYCKLNNITPNINNQTII